MGVNTLTAADQQLSCLNAPPARLLLQYAVSNQAADTEAAPATYNPVSDVRLREVVWGGGGADAEDHQHTHTRRMWLLGWLETQLLGT